MHWILIWFYFSAFRGGQIQGIDMFATKEQCVYVMQKITQAAERLR